MCQTIGCCVGGRTFACFDCRRTAKGVHRVTDPAKTNKTVHPNCPVCRRPMVNLGLKVEVPRRSATRKWRQLGERFGVAP